MNEYTVSSTSLEAQPTNTTQPDTLNTMEEELKTKLQLYFMSPLKKWSKKQYFPIKFLAQLLKVVFVTIQLVLFASMRGSYVNYTQGNKIAFSHLFLKGWDSSREVTSYPPEAGPLAIYTKEEFYNTIDYACNGYENISEALGAYSYVTDDYNSTNMVLCWSQYKEAAVFGFNKTYYMFDSDIVDDCKYIICNDFRRNLGISFSALVKASLKFSLKTVDLSDLPPNCYIFNIVINFDNENHDGQVLLSLDSQPMRLKCKNYVEDKVKYKTQLLLESILDIEVFLVSLFSLVLCGRAIWKEQKLKEETDVFFTNHLGAGLSKDEKKKFFSWWWIMIIASDFLVMVGSFIKILIEREDFFSNYWNICSISLGLGNMLIWFGMLRYFGFFKTGEIVILALAKVIPHIFKFLVCAAFIYVGFVLSGWLILGPYHIKFSTVSGTSECLFSLISGDDMFATFSTMSSSSLLLWWFSRIYLYAFIILYFYIILNLFISVIGEAYDVINQQNQKNSADNLKNRLDDFIGDVKEDEDDFWKLLKECFCSKRKIYLKLTHNCFKLFICLCI